MEPSNKKIILIDDEPDFVQNVQSYFQMFGYECLAAANGKEGLEMIEQQKPRLMIVDILMPNMDGYTMLRELKRRKVNILCIIITAKGKLKELFELEKVDRFLTKPFELKKLKEIVDEMLGTESTAEGTPAPTGDIKDTQLAAAGREREGDKILVIDDEQKLTNSIRDYLEMKGYVVYPAYSGDEGLRGVESFKPHLVVTDILMPRMDGYSMIKEIRKKNRDIPIIVVTAKEKLRDFIEIEGVDFFITKPFDLEVLERKIREILVKTS